MIKTLKRALIDILIVLSAFAIAIMFTACGEHKHSFSSDWSANETEHWHKATCEHNEERLDAASHIDIDSDGKCDICKYIMYTLSNISTYEELTIALASNDKVIRLTSDVVVNTELKISRDVILDLNGKVISNTTDIWNTNIEPNTLSLILVENNATLTITGDGKILAKENDCYGIYVKEGNLVFESGELRGNCSAIQVQKGTATILDGKFQDGQKYSVSGDTQYTYTLNLIDANYADGSGKIIVKGGEFINFNPANNRAEGQGTNFVAQGYKSIQIEGTTNYKVVAV